MITWSMAGRYFLAFLSALTAVLALFGPHPFPTAVIWTFFAAYWAHTAMVRYRMVIARSETMHIESPRPDPLHVEVDWNAAYPIRTHDEALDLPRFPQSVRGDFEPEKGRPVYRLPNVSEEQARAILKRQGFAWAGPIPVVPSTRVQPPRSPSPGFGYAWDGSQWIPSSASRSDRVTP